MSCLLLAECLNEVLENLDDDKITLHSCLLVSRFWCKISVEILWRNIWRFKCYIDYDRQLEVNSTILSTLISCLSNESKELLHKNEIFISTPTSKPPLFNYLSFFKVLSIDEIGQIIHDVIKNVPFGLDRKCLVTKEILKSFMNQVSSLKSLTYRASIYSTVTPNNISFTHFPGAKDCLTDLSELHCSSNVHSEFFYELSQICHNLQSLTIYFDFKCKVSNELKELVSSQNSLKNLKLSADGLKKGWTDIIPALMKHTNTLTKLQLYGDLDRLPVSFVSSFLNLQEIEFSFSDESKFEDFKELQYVTFPNLQILKVPYRCSKPEYLTKFLEINGKNLKECYLDNELLLDFDIAEYCPNLKKLFVPFSNDTDELEMIFNGCKYLEGIVIMCGDSFVIEKEILETVAMNSPESFYELKLHEPELLPEDLESFFINWKNRASKKSLSLIIVDDYSILTRNGEFMKIIEKYKNLGVVKKFEARKCRDEEVYL